MEMKTPAKRGFTLIELLIVVAIIAILAAIAVPNFLEAQTRAKTARAKSDMRTVAVGLESYYVDNNRYPPNYYGGNSWWLYVPWSITSPIAYVTEGVLIDVFRTPFNWAQQEAEMEDSNPNSIRRYLYLNTKQFSDITSGGIRLVRGDGTPVTPRPATIQGAWQVSSYGPDLDYGPDIPTRTGANIAIRYDPTNGTLSRGDIIRTQNDPEGQGVDRQ